jgi:hypothetical protein
MPITMKQEHINMRRTYLQPINICEYKRYSLILQSPYLM